MNSYICKGFKAICGVLILGIAVLLSPVDASAESNPIDNFSFDDCDPFQARARIMDVNALKAELIAAEQTIHVVNWLFDDRQLTTELTDTDGEPLELGSLRQGQWILIKGFKHIEGGVIASLIQRIEPPQRSKPVVRKISKTSRRNRRIQQRAAAKNH